MSLTSWLRERFEAWMGFLYIKYHSRVVGTGHTPCHTCRHRRWKLESPDECAYYGEEKDMKKCRLVNSDDNGINCLSYRPRRGLLRLIWSLIW